METLWSMRPRQLLPQGVYIPTEKHTATGNDDRRTCYLKLSGVSRQCMHAQSLSWFRLLVTLWTVAHKTPLLSTTPGVCSDSCPLSWWCDLIIVMLCHPILLWASAFSGLRVFPSESALHIRWPEYQNFSFSSSSSHGLLLLFTHSVVSHSATPWTAACQAFLSFTISQRFLKLKSTESMISSIISSSVTPFSSCFQSFQHQNIFQWVGSSHQVAKILELQLQHQSFQWTFRVDFLWDWLGWSPCCPRDSQESSPAPQFKSINSLALSLLYGPTLTSLHDYWNNHSFD